MNAVNTNKTTGTKNMKSTTTTKSSASKRAVYHCENYNGYSALFWMENSDAEMRNGLKNKTGGLPLPSGRKLGTYKKITTGFKTTESLRDNAGQVSGTLRIIQGDNGIKYQFFSDYSLKALEDKS